MILPDLPAACFLLLSLVLFDWGCQQRAAGRLGAGLAGLFGAGISVGIGYLAKETLLLLLPFYFVYWLWHARRESSTSRIVAAGAAFLVGFVLVFAAETAALSLLTGRTYLRLGWTVGEDTLATGFREYRFGYYPLERLKAIASELRFWFYKSRLDLWLLAAAAIYPLLRGRRLAVWTLALWFFAYHTWGSSKLTEYVPPSLQARYFTPMLPLLFVVYAFVVVRLYELLAGRLQRAGAVVRIAAVVLMAAHPLLGLRVADRQAGKAYHADVVINTTRALQAASGRGQPIVLSATLSKRLELYLEHHAPGQTLSAADLPPDGPATARLAASPFCYIEVHRPPSRAIRMRPHGLDRLLHAALPQAEGPSAPPRAGAELTIAGRAGRVRLLGWFITPHSRSKGLGQAIFGWTSPPDFTARSVCLYEWAAD